VRWVASKGGQQAIARTSNSAAGFHQLALPAVSRPTIDAVAVDVETSIEIECPRSVVAAFASNPDNATHWYVNIKAINWKTAPPAVVGSRIAFVAQLLGRQIAYTYEVREIVQDERFVMSTAQGPFPMQTSYAWQDTESGGTRMTLRNSGELSGFGKLAAPMIAAAMRRANGKDLARLKAILEHKS
jgi:hypothetical protein